MLQSLSPTEVEKLMQDTWAVESLAMKLFRKDPTLQNHLQSWYRSHQLPAGSSDGKRDVVQKLVGRSPDKILVGEFTNYIWGCSLEGNPLLLMVSERGTSIEVLPEYPQHLLKDMLYAFRKLLVNATYRDDLFFTDKVMNKLIKEGAL